MYTVRITHHPAPGKGAELRAALEEHSRAMNADHPSHNVSQLLYAAEPTFVNAIRHENLAALEAYGAQRGNDSAWQARTAKISGCLDRPQTSELHETLATSPVTAPFNYTLRMTFDPALGQVGPLRQALEALVNAPSAGCVHKVLSTQVAPPDGANFTLALFFSDLAGLDEFRAANRTDAAFNAFRAQTPTLLQRHARNELHRVLVRFADK